MSKTLDGQKTLHLVDHHNPTGYAQVLEEIDAATVTVLRSYTLGLDVVAQADAEGNVHYFLHDGHGSTRALLDPTGEIAVNDMGTPDTADDVPQIFAYDAYGNPIGFDPALALTTLLYSGEHLDKLTNLQYLRARYYDLATGRFTRLDPFFGTLHDPQSIHKYLYTHADPVNGIDPSGQSLGIVLATAGLLAGLTALHSFVLTNIALVRLVTDDPVPDGFMVNLVPYTSYGTHGAVFTGGINIYLDFASLRLYLYVTPEVGTAPTSVFYGYRGFGWGFTAGFVWKAPRPEDVAGYTTVATIPRVLFRFNPILLSATSWGLAMTHLAKYQLGNIQPRQGVFQVSQSLSGPTFGIFFGHRTYSFSSSVSYSYGPWDLVGGLGRLSHEVGRLVRQIGDVIAVRPDHLDTGPELVEKYKQILSILT